MSTLKFPAFASIPVRNGKPVIMRMDAPYNLFRLILEQGRLEAGFSELGMAYLLGLSRSEYQLLEQGRVRPSDQIIAYLADILRVRPQDLVMKRSYGDNRDYFGFYPLPGKDADAPVS